MQIREALGSPRKIFLGIDRVDWAADVTVVSPFRDGMKSALLEVWSADERDLTRRMKGMRKQVKERPESQRCVLRGLPHSRCVILVRLATRGGRERAMNMEKPTDESTHHTADTLDRRN